MASRFVTKGRLCISSAPPAPHDDIVGSHVVASGFGCGMGWSPKRDADPLSSVWESALNAQRPSNGGGGGCAGGGKDRGTRREGGDDKKDSSSAIGGAGRASPTLCPEILEQVILAAFSAHQLQSTEANNATNAVLIS